MMHKDLLSVFDPMRLHYTSNLNNHLPHRSLIDYVHLHMNGIPFRLHRCVLYHMASFRLHIPYTYSLVVY